MAVGRGCMGRLDDGCGRARAMLSRGLGRPWEEGGPSRAMAEQEQKVLAQRGEGLGLCSFSVQGLCKGGGH